MRGRREDRREDRQDDRRPGTAASGGNHQYQMRQKLVSIGDDFWIEDSHGAKAFKVNGKAMRLRQTLAFEDAHGTELCHIQERVMHVKDTMEIEGPNGQRLALVKKALISPVRDRLTVKIKDGPDLDVQGNILDHEYSIGEGRNKIAEVSKRWFRLRDTYGVEIDAGQDDILVLAVTVCIDQMT